MAKGPSWMNCFLWHKGGSVGKGIVYYHAIKDGLDEYNALPERSKYGRNIALFFIAIFPAAFAIWFGLMVDFVFMTFCGIIILCIGLGALIYGITGLIEQIPLA